ncbi:CsbD family protein [Dyella sp. 2HG41-7]|uniref:CsbD family protein n=1 Tax=Dyella sp. 2HG41-7 TaxID=2883239 RepID=UPI001F43B31A|nr:CsbD family protein [Dyella sp. 2HG41-7]
MNRDTISGQWKQISGRIKQQWGKWTHDDLKVVEGHSDMLSGRMQERFAVARTDAQRQIRAIERDLDISRYRPSPRHH